MKNAILLTLALCLIFSVTTWADELVLYSEAGAGTVEVSETGPDSGFGAPVSPVGVTPHSAWTTITGATWISSANPRETNGQYGSWRLFTREFTLPDNAYNISATIEIAADNAYAVSCNSTPVGDSGVSGSTNGNGGVGTVAVVTWSGGPFPFNATTTHTFAPIPGTNELEILLRNWPGSSGGTWEGGSGNPTGLLYKVVVTYDVLLTVDIDIKPGSYPNALNSDGHGVIPVAILGSETFDVTQIDVSTLSFAGLAVRVKGKGTPQCSVEDVSGDFSEGPEGAPDGYPDLVCHFVDDPDAWTPGDGEATVTGNLLDGTPIEGSDTINVVPLEK